MNLTKTNFTSGIGIVSHLFSSAVCLVALFLICSSASAQNLFVSGHNWNSAGGREILDDEANGAIFEFTWDGRQSIFASANFPRDVTFDNRGNLFFADCSGCWTPHPVVVIYKIAPNGAWTTFASGPGYYTSYLASDTAGNLFVADSDHGIIYKYKLNGSRTTFASGLYRPVGLACDSMDNLFAVDNSAGNIHQGSVYRYKPDGSRTTIAVLDQSDRPTDLALDSMGNLFMADLGGNIYRYDLHILRRYPRTTFGSVPNSAQSLAFDSAGSLFVVDAGDVNGSGNMIHKFTQQGVRSRLPRDRVLVKPLDISPSSPRCVVSEKQEWIRRLIAIAPGAVQ